MIYYILCCISIFYILLHLYVIWILNHVNWLNAVLSWWLMPLQIRNNISYFTDFHNLTFSICEINIYFCRCILMIPKIETTEGANCVDFSDDESWIQVNHGGTKAWESFNSPRSVLEIRGYLLLKTITYTSHWKKLNQDGGQWLCSNQSNRLVKWGFFQKLREINSLLLN